MVRSHNEATCPLDRSPRISKATAGMRLCGSKGGNRSAWTHDTIAPFYRHDPWIMHIWNILIALSNLIHVFDESRGHHSLLKRLLVLVVHLPLLYIRCDVWGWYAALFNHVYMVQKTSLICSNKSDMACIFVSKVLASLYKVHGIH